MFSLLKPTFVLSIILNIAVISHSKQLFAQAYFVSSPSFDCGKATSHDEKIICQHKELSLLDTGISTKYQQLKEFLNGSEKVSLETAQRAWLKERRQSEYYEDVLMRMKRRHQELTHAIAMIILPKLDDIPKNPAMVGKLLKAFSTPLSISWRGFIAVMHNPTPSLLEIRQLYRPLETELKLTLQPELLEEYYRILNEEVGIDAAFAMLRIAYEAEIKEEIEPDIYHYPCFLHQDFRDKVTVFYAYYGSSKDRIIKSNCPKKELFLELPDYQRLIEILSQLDQKTAVEGNLGSLHISLWNLQLLEKQLLQQDLAEKNVIHLQHLDPMPGQHCLNQLATHFATKAHYNELETLVTKVEAQLHHYLVNIGIEAPLASELTPKILFKIIELHCKFLNLSQNNSEAKSD